MKEKPILFSGPMVRAILEGRKTQTRRVVKHIPALGWPEQWCEKYGNDSPDTKAMLGDYRKFCPYGQPGDRLWVRETWRPAVITKDTIKCDYRADGWSPECTARWKPSIHMPRWASRINLEIVSIRVERLNDISQKDAMAEGAPPSHPTIDAVSREFGYPDFSRSWFAQLWESINGQGSWNQNPWVWVIEFNRV